jgi:hypothetical protein
MQSPKPPDQKPIAKTKDERRAFVLRMDRAAGDLNPFLVVLTIGLLMLDLTLYLGMTVSREPFVARAAHQITAPASPASGAVPEDNH